MKKRKKNVYFTFNNNRKWVDLIVVIDFIFLKQKSIKEENQIWKLTLGKRWELIFVRV